MVFSYSHTVHHTREGGGCPRLRTLRGQNARKRLRRLSVQDARRVGDGRWKMGGGFGRWAAGSCPAFLPPPPASLWRAARRCLYRMEKGGRGIARRPAVVTGIGLTGNTSARHDAANKTRSGRASYSVGRASPVTSGTSPRLTRTSTGCG